MNAQELFLDVSSGRFLDGDSTIPTTKPSFFSDEVRKIKLFNRRVKNNKVTAITPSPDARFKMRLGTATQKLADATDVPTAPVNLITALASVVTLPATQATGSGIVATYSPVTATFDATVSTESPVTAQFQALFRTEPAVTALFKSGISLVTPVTASITVGILTAVTQFIPTTAGSLTSATFSFIPTATFSAAIDRGSNIFNYLAGSSGNLIYPRAPKPLYLTAQMNSPQAAVVCCGFSDGGVSTISIIGRGQGYPNGNYRLVFSGGGATAGTVTATAEVSITSGGVNLITLSSGGSGYASAPIATLFTPDKSLLSILPTNALGEVNGKRQFSWVLGRTPGDSAPIRFTQPDTTSVVTFNTVPSASLVFVQGNTWEINIGNSGYGYVATPTVTHDAAPASTAKITLSRTVCGGFLQSISTAGLLFIRNGGIPLLPEFYFQPTSRSTNILNMANGISNDFSPIPGTTTTLTLLRNNTGTQKDDEAARLISELEQSSFAGKEFFATVTVGSTNIGALVRASVPQINLDYDVEVSSVYRSQGVLVGASGGKRVDGGGIWETSFEIVDYGDSYANNFSSSNLVGLLPLKTGSTILQSPIEQVVTIPLQASNGYANTIISQSPTIATRPGRTSTETFISSGGLGFVDRGTSREPVAQAFSGFSATVTSQTVTAGGLIISTTPGIVTTARIIAFPKAYTPGTYDCEVASPATGTRAQIQLIVTSTTASVVILNGGSGYTTAPVITAPAPNGRNGFVNLLVATNAFSGYTAGVMNPLEFAPSVATGGTAEGEFEVGESKVTFASRVGIVGGQQALIFNGVSTDPFGQLGVRRKEEPPIPAGSILLGASNKTVVAESDDGLQEIQQFIQKFAFIRLTNQGFGYTTPPAVLAPAPSRAVGGTIVDIRLTNIPKGYKENQTYALQVTTAPDPTGSSEASFQIFKVDRLLSIDKDPQKTFVIENPNPDDLKNSFRSFNQFASNSRVSSPTLVISDDFYLGLNFTNGFSYTTAPTITAPSPDNDLLGNIIGLLPTNNPVGYRPDTTYPLVIGSSPRLDGGAAGEFTVSSLGVISTRITDGGFGYTTKPSVVAPAPDLVQGTISGVSVSTLGRGFAPGAYPCNITEAPLGGETASVLFNVDGLGVGQFEVGSKGRGYVTRPIVSVPTQSGNIVSGITITCGGSFYEQSTARFQVLDPSGLGASFGEPIILSGKINQVPVVARGYGFSANPVIQFSAPTQPAISPLELSSVEGEFNITTASANAILLTAIQRDILMEVYETDGTNEQVIAQATVSLAKRVLE